MRIIKEVIALLYSHELDKQKTCRVVHTEVHRSSQCNFKHLLRSVVFDFSHHVCGYMDDLPWSTGLPTSSLEYRSGDEDALNPAPYQRQP